MPVTMRRKRVSVSDRSSHTAVVPVIPVAETIKLEEALRPAVTRERTRSYVVHVTVLLSILALVLLLQFSSGAFQAELGAYPDEASHYVSGLMVRDYIAAGFPAPPLEYAKNYRNHYPKISIGHWPPMFYGIQAAWMLLFSADRNAILLLMALITFLVAALLYWHTSRIFGTWAGILAGCGFVAVAGVQEQTAMVMPDVLVALFGTLAAIHFGRFLDTGVWWDCGFFALYSSFAILTKGNGWSLALIPPIALCLDGKLHWLKRKGLWVAAALVTALCVPWYVYAHPMIRHVWTAEGVGGVAAGQILSVYMRLAGPAILILAIAGIATLCPPLRRSGDRLPGIFPAMAGMVLSVWLFHTFVPLWIEKRKLLMALPALLFLAIGGAARILNSLSRYRPWPHVALPALVVTLFLVQAFRIPEKPRFGCIEAAEATLAQQPTAPATFLVSGWGEIEGAFIAELAMRDRKLRNTVLRGSNMLAHSDWNGGEYQLIYRSAEQVRQFLKQAGVSVVAVQTLAASLAPPHHMLLNEVMSNHPEEWTPLQFTPRDSRARGHVRLFRRADLVSR